jgi:hypothetical protein
VSRLKVEKAQDQTGTKTGNDQTSLGPPKTEIQGDENSDHGMPLGIDRNTTANRQ